MKTDNRISPCWCFPCEGDLPLLREVDTMTLHGPTFEPG